MSDARVRTSLAGFPSAVTEEDMERRLAMSEAEQAKYFHRYGLALVPTRGKVEGLARFIQMGVEAWARVRFGKREERA
jgi:hypothetical protein